MWVKFYFSLVVSCLIPYTLSEADAIAVPEASADADPKSEAKASFSNGCPTSMKGCSNGVCLPEKWFCDGDKDCPWGEDEQNCGGQVHWQLNTQPKPQGQWVQPQQPWTIPLPQEPQPEPEPQAWQPQQPQGWQFQNQLTHGNIRTDPIACPVDSFPCGTSCLPANLRCNGIRDCSDGSDESFCSNTPGTEQKCSEDEVQCFAGNCIKKTKLCDGFVDCKHYEDEFACSFIKNPEYAYRCIESCIGIQRPNCSSNLIPQPPPPPPPPPPTTQRPIIRFCDQGYTLIYDRCIRVTVYPPLDWQGARSASQAAGSQLVEIDNGDFFLELQAYLNQSRYESYSYWTGASDHSIEGDWKWIGSLKKVHLGAPLWSIAREGNTYQQQPAGGREQNCGLLEDCPFQYMNDENCEKKYPYICQRPARVKYQ